MPAQVGQLSFWGHQLLMTYIPAIGGWGGIKEQVSSEQSSANLLLPVLSSWFTSL